MSIRNQVGHYIEYCNGIIDEMIRHVAVDENESNLPRLKKAFQNIHDRFFTNPDAFKFDSTVAMPLKKDSPDVYEQLNSLVEILQGRSEMMPLPALTFDGAGIAQPRSLEYQAAIRSQLCAGVALKINTAVSELSTKRKELAAEASDISESKRSRKAARPDFEAQIAAVRARQELRNTEAGCIQLVTENGLNLEDLDPIFQNNKNVVLAAVIQNGRALQFAHSRLRNDNDVVREALKHPD